MRFFDENIIFLDGFSLFFCIFFFLNNSTWLKSIFQPVQTLLPSSFMESMTPAAAVSNVGLFIAMIGAIACHRGDAAHQDTSLSATERLQRDTCLAQLQKEKLTGLWKFVFGRRC